LIGEINSPFEGGLKMIIKSFVIPLSAVFVLVGCSNGGTSSGTKIDSMPLTYDQVSTIVEDQNNSDVVRQADFDENVQYGWAKCKVTWVYVYTNKTVIYTSGCGYSYFFTRRARFRNALADVATQAMVKNWKLWFRVNNAGTAWTYFVL